MARRKVFLYDTTLRDGAQSPGVSFTVNDKLKIAEALDSFGIDYIEGGWPGSNPKDMEFFERIQEKKLQHAKIVAFGSTRRADVSASKDLNLKKMLQAGVEYVTLFGKTWDLHVKEALKTSLEENLKMIEDSIRFLKRRGITVFYDAEHFFDGYKSNREYAIKTIEAAANAGAEAVILCDTNGGSLPSFIKDAVEDVRSALNVPLGIHCHNDCGLAAANSIAAVEAGCDQIQGTINGLGERCGNADLTQIIGIVGTKTNFEFFAKRNLHRLKELAYFVSETANMQVPVNHPFIGSGAFSHKGGVHINAVVKNPKTYEHINPSLVGNERHMLMSELAGRTSLTLKAKELGIELDRSSKEAKELMSVIQALEHKGYQFESADASLRVLLYKHAKLHHQFYELLGFRVIIEKKGASMITEATVKISVDGKVQYTVAEGDGPVNALDIAMRSALRVFYPTIEEMRLTDFKVRVLDSASGTAAKVRVLILSQDLEDEWTTIGVSENIIEASWLALADSYDYKLIKDKRRKKSNFKS